MVTNLILSCKKKSLANPSTMKPCKNIKTHTFSSEGQSWSNCVNQGNQPSSSKDQSYHKSIDLPSKLIDWRSVLIVDLYPIFILLTRFNILAEYYPVF